MGRFSTTVQVKCNSGRTSFIDSFCDVMKKRGFVPCSEDQATASYILAYSEGGWTTLANEEYKDNPKKAYEDSQQIATSMKTSSFSVEVVDSDFAVLKLFDGNFSDEVVVGDGSGYGIEDPSRGNRECWEPLLAFGKMWEEFSQTAEKENTFVEDTLVELAEILGIVPDYICADYSELSEGDSNEKLSQLHFKKAKEKSKTMSLNSAFIQVFGEALEPLGFKKIKGRYPYFVRVVPGGEIIHVVTVIPDQGIMRNENAFVICGGVATVYRGKIDLTVNPRNLNWFIRNTDVYGKLYSAKNNSEMFEKLNHFIYTLDGEYSLTDELAVALDYTKQFLLPVLDKVTTLSECADYYRKFKPMALHIYCDKDWGISHYGGEDNEGLMLLKIYDMNAYEIMLREEIERFKEDTLRMMNTGRSLYTQEMLDTEYRTHFNALKKLLAEYDILLNDPKRNKEVFDELERRKSVNSEVLFKLGLSL